MAELSKLQIKELIGLLLLLLETIALTLGDKLRSSYLLYLALYPGSISALHVSLSMKLFMLSHFPDAS